VQGLLPPPKNVDR
jgi:vacuole morphology and inheritance protein 14